MEEDREVEPLLLGRPFLATGRALIDVEMGELMLRTHGEQIMFNVFEAMKRHDEDTECFWVDLVEEVVEDVFAEETPTPPLERVLVNSIDDLEEEWEREIELCLKNLDACRVDEHPRVEEELKVKSKEELSSIVQEKGVSTTQEVKPIVPKLKQLPSHLKYVFLGDDDSHPAIISSALTPLEEEKLLRVLRDNKEAIGWKISDLKGISPTFCMHKIKLEEEFKPVVQPQRRLNPTMK
ncbi:hypothetical protein A2U01_0012248 [Trifolium medium]|uniref:Reverse transcriptase domain-containing protein n=1 Tax=Trifolium medium TaxID=97028 RepID=A0A392MV16_9FABA|nr:hypothetical protein [Trifolium medium]